MLNQLGLTSTLLPDGRQALKHLQEIANRGEVPSDVYSMIISDVEMPDMDGYTLAAEIRRDPRMSDMYIILHTSLSGVFNNAMVATVGANKFVPKYSPNDLAQAVLERIHNMPVVA